MIRFDSYTMTEIKIRRLERADLATARKIAELFRSVGERSPEPSDAHFKAMLRRDRFWALAAFVDDEFAGGLTAYELPMFKRETRELMLYEIEVVERHRRCGVGRALVAYLLERAREASFAAVFVLTERENLAANRLYLSTGGEADPESIMYMYEL